MPLIHRHETLSVTKQELEQRGGKLVQELEKGQRHLDVQKQQHNTDQLVGTMSKLIVLVKFMTLGYINYLMFATKTMSLLGVCVCGCVCVR